MPKVSVSLQSSVSATSLWDVWDDFGAIQNFHPAVNNSGLLKGSSDTGVGAQRFCELGKHRLEEEIVEYSPGKHMRVSIRKSTLPIQSGWVDIWIKPTSDKTSSMELEFSFTAKAPVGLRTVMHALMSLQFKSMLHKLMRNAAQQALKNTDKVPQAV